MSLKQRQRMFLALPLNASHQHSIQAFRRQHAQLEQPGLRWLAAENLHITVFFLGDVFVRDSSAVAGAIRSALLGFTPFSLHFEAFTLQPRKRPRMIWARFQQHALFSELATRVGVACQPYLLNQGPAHKQPIPHITVARMKSLSCDLILVNNIKLPAVRVNRCQLWLSENRAGGTTYTSLATFKLA